MDRFLMKGYKVLLLAFCIGWGLPAVEASKHQGDSLVTDSQEVKRRCITPLEGVPLEEHDFARQGSSLGWEELLGIVRNFPENIITNPILQDKIFSYYFQGFYSVEPQTLAALIPDLEGRASDNPKALWLLINAEASGEVSSLKACTTTLIHALQDQNSNAAHLVLGRCYIGGVGLKQDKITGLNIIRLAAEAGDPSAQCLLGKCYFNGLGVKINLYEAVKWCLRAAEQGHALAEFNLGTAYHYGRGVEQNLAEARHWFNKSAAQGYAIAQRQLGCDFFKAASDAQALGNAVYWFRRAATQGDVVAQRRLGGCYLKGSGIHKDPTTAAHWFHKAADQGDPVAHFSLGCLYLEGIGVEKDVKTAFWYALLANKTRADLNQPLEAIKRKYIPMLVRKYDNHGTYVYTLEDRLLNSYKHLTDRLARMNHSSDGPVEGDQAIFQASNLPLRDPESLMQLENNLQELRQMLKINLPRALTRAGFCITNLRFGRDLTGSKENAYMQCFMVKGRKYLCLGEDNVRFTRDASNIFAQTALLAKQAIKDIKSGIKTLDSFLQRRAGHHDEEATTLELRAFYHDTVGMLEELQATTGQTKAHIEKVILNSTAQRNKIFEEKFDSCFN